MQQQTPTAMATTEWTSMQAPWIVPNPLQATPLEEVHRRLQMQSVREQTSRRLLCRRLVALGFLLSRAPPR